MQSRLFFVGENTMSETNRVIFPAQLCTARLKLYSSCKYGKQDKAYRFSAKAASTLSTVETDDGTTALCRVVFPPCISTVLPVHDEPNGDT